MIRNPLKNRVDATLVVYVFESLRLAVLVWRISYNESVLADVNTNVSHNYKLILKLNIQHQNILDPSLQNAGSKPNELSGFGC